jgi:hypothetical protein
LKEKEQRINTHAADATKEDIDGQKSELEQVVNPTRAARVQLNQKRMMIAMSCREPNKLFVWKIRL